MDTTKTLETITVASTSLPILSPSDLDGQFFLGQLPYLSNSTLTTVYGNFQGQPISFISLPSCVSLYANFSNCSKLTSLYLPNCVSIYSSSAFYNCSALSIVSLPVLTTFGYVSSIFTGCTNLQTVNIPNITNISASGIFARCTNLLNVNMPNLVSITGSQVFSMCGLSILSLPNLQTADDYTFASCSRLMKVNLPKGGVMCDTGCFERCTLLSIVALGTSNGVYIANSAFYSCQKLEYFILSQITSAGTLANSKAFYSTPLSISTYLGYYGSIYVPSSLVTTMQTTGNWAIYAARITSIENLPASIKTELGIE